MHVLWYIFTSRSGQQMLIAKVKENSLLAWTPVIVILWLHLSPKYLNLMHFRLLECVFSFFFKAAACAFQL